MKENNNNIINDDNNNENKNENDDNNINDKNNNNENGNNNINDDDNNNEEDNNNEYENNIPLLEIEINLKHGIKKKIYVYEGDTSKELAKNFAILNHLDNNMESKLEVLIQNEIDKLESK